MMESAHFRERDDIALLRRLDPPKLRGIFVQTQMGPPAMIICEITFKDPAQMDCVQHDHVVQTFTPNQTDEAFHIRRLPGSSKSRRDFTRATARRSPKLNQQSMPPKLQENPTEAEQFINGWNYCQRQALKGPPWHGPFFIAVGTVRSAWTRLADTLRRTRSPAGHCRYGSCQRFRMTF